MDCCNFDKDSATSYSRCIRPNEHTEEVGFPNILLSIELLQSIHYAGGTWQLVSKLEKF